MATNKKTVAKKTTSKKVDEKPLIKDSMDTEPRKMEASEVILMSLEKRYVSKAKNVLEIAWMEVLGVGFPSGNSNPSY